jgi:hypothetical protein
MFVFGNLLTTNTLKTPGTFAGFGRFVANSTVETVVAFVGDRGNIARESSPTGSTSFLAVVFGTFKMVARTFFPLAEFTTDVTSRTIEI